MRDSTGSSLMPQKKNPDLFELLRGKSGRLVGSLMTLLMVLKGLPSAYDKDLQEDKEPLFDAAEQPNLALPVAAGAIATATFNHARMRGALDAAMLATDVADYLVHRGVPFREAHKVVGQLVRAAETQATTIHQLTFDTFRQRIEPLARIPSMCLQVDRSPAARTAIGATAPSAVAAHIPSRPALRWPDQTQVRMGRLHQSGPVVSRTPSISGSTTFIIPCTNGDCRCLSYYLSATDLTRAETNSCSIGQPH